MKALFIFAHPDDESYGPAGTIAKLATVNDVTVVSLCNGSRPGDENVAAARAGTFMRNCEQLGAAHRLFNSQDCTLTYAPTLKMIEEVIREQDPDVVYTHNISDIHADHRLVAECCMVACRPKPESNVHALYMCEIPASTEWAFGQFGDFKPNIFVDVSDYMELKTQLLSQYSTEIYSAPDARSVENMQAIAAKRGMQVGVDFAEAFQLVYAIG
jgi:LmbE family N-acetylglucosaminyl deacetylase